MFAEKFSVGLADAIGLKQIEWKEEKRAKGSRVLMKDNLIMITFIR